MIKITDHRGRTRYLAPSAIATLTEAAPSIVWHGIRCFIKCFDGSVIETGDTADRIATSIAAAQGDEASRSRLKASHAELLHMLYTALPVVEDAKADPAYKPGHIAKIEADMRAAINGAGGAL